MIRGGLDQTEPISAGYPHKRWRPPTEWAIHVNQRHGLAVALLRIQLSPELIVGAPEWVRRERYDVTVTCPWQRNDWRPSEFQQMLEALLRDRFGLRSHVEPREMDIYVLVFTRDDRRFGPRLHPESIDCSEPIAARKAHAHRPAGQPVCGGRSSDTQIAFQGMRIMNLANTLRLIVEKPVLDRTELRGRFDIDLDWAPGLSTGDRAEAVDRLSIFTALEEQLGLRLRPDRALQEVLVIDDIDRPTEN